MPRLSLVTVQLGGIEHDMAGDLRCDARGIGRSLCDRGGHAAQSKPQPVGGLKPRHVGTLVKGIICFQSEISQIEVLW